MENIRAKIKRRFSHKDKNANFDEFDEGDEETTSYLQSEVDAAEKDEKYPEGKPGSLLNKLIQHGNSKTEKELQAEMAERQAQTKGTTTAP